MMIEFTKREKLILKEFQSIVKEQSQNIKISDDFYVEAHIILDKLESSGYIRDMQADGLHWYRISDVFSALEADIKDYEKQIRKLNRRELKIAIISSLFGTIIGAIATYLMSIAIK